MARWYNEGNSASENGAAGQRFNLRSGGRTRHVVNIAGPGRSGDAAYTFTAATSVPSAATDGYKNDGLQKTLHILAMNNNTGQNCALKIWAYHSFAGQWAILQGVDPTDGTHHDIVLTIADDSDDYFIAPIEGVERIAIQCTNYNSGANDPENVTVYLGVNSI